MIPLRTPLVARLSRAVATIKDRTGKLPNDAIQKSWFEKYGVNKLSDAPDEQTMESMVLDVERMAREGKIA